MERYSEGNTRQYSTARIGELLSGKFLKRFGPATRPFYLISSKIALAEQEQIKTKVNIEYPHNTNIRCIDLTTISGNLITSKADKSSHG